MRGLPKDSGGVRILNEAAPTTRGFRIVCIEENIARLCNSCLKAAMSLSRYFFFIPSTLDRELVHPYPVYLFLLWQTSRK